MVGASWLVPTMDQEGRLIYHRCIMMFHRMVLRQELRGDSGISHGVEGCGEMIELYNRDDVSKRYICSNPNQTRPDVMYNGTDNSYANPTDFFFGFVSSSLAPSGVLPFLSCFFTFASFINANFASRYLISPYPQLKATRLTSSLVSAFFFSCLCFFLSLLGPATVSSCFISSGSFLRR